MIVNQLITESYYLSGVCSRDFLDPRPDQIYNGLIFLNELFSEKDFDTGLIPFYVTEEFDAVVNQEQYIIENLVELSTLTYEINNVRYQMQAQNRDKYFGSSRVPVLSSLPQIYFAQKQQNDMLIYVYPFPSQTMTFQISGKYGLSNVTQFQELDTIYTESYQAYLKYCLAERLCEFNVMPTPPGVLKRISFYQGKMSKQMSVMDLTTRKISTFSSGGDLNESIRSANFSPWVAPNGW